MDEQLHERGLAVLAMKPIHGNDISMRISDRPAPPAPVFRFTVAVAALLLAAFFWGPPVNAARIKDLADIQGVRQNQLVGYGLVVGLDGTGDGDDSSFTLQSLAAMLDKMGITVKPEEIEGDNVAAVMVTAELPAFARVGSRIDVLVSSIGGAGSLQGGTLLLTPLRAADGQVYAVSQGPVSTGGFSVEGNAGRVTKNFPTVGRVVAGAMIERELAVAFDGKQSLTLALRTPDFTTAARMAQAINEAVFDRVATTPDGGTVEVRIPGATPVTWSALWRCSKAWTSTPMSNPRW